MHLRRWLQLSNRSLLSLSQEARIAYDTALRAKRGVPVSLPTAQKLSAATGGDVTVDELVNPTTGEGAA